MLNAGKDSKIEKTKLVQTLSTTSVSEKISEKNWVNTDWLSSACINLKAGIKAISEPIALTEKITSRFFSAKSDSSLLMRAKILFKSPSGISAASKWFKNFSRFSLMAG